MAGKGGLSRLSALVQGASEPLSPEEEAEAERDEAKLAADTQKVLDFAAKIAGEDSIFDIQILIESCAEELRTQIRDQAENDE